MTKTRLRLNRKPNGQHFRITVEHKLSDISPLLSLQQAITIREPKFSPKETEYFHLTLLHLGIPQDIYYEIRRQEPKLAMENFMEGFLELLYQLHRTIQKMPTTTAITAQKLGYYGSRKTPAIALSVQRNPQIEAMHSQVYQDLINYLSNYNIANIDQFITHSRNFRHSPPTTFDPHITLGRTLSQSVVLPTIPQPIKLTIGQPYLAHVTVV